jgi:hypothetical protein
MWVANKSVGLIVAFPVIQEILDTPRKPAIVSLGTNNIHTVRGMLLCRVLTVSTDQKGGDR